MFWNKKNPNKRIEKLKSIISDMNFEFKQVKLAVEILERKMQSKFFKKKDLSLEDEVTEKSISPDGLDELRNIAHGDNKIGRKTI